MSWVSFQALTKLKLWHMIRSWAKKKFALCKCMWVGNISLGQPQEKVNVSDRKKISVILFQTNLHTSKIDSYQSFGIWVCTEIWMLQIFFILQYNLLKVATWMPSFHNFISALVSFSSLWIKMEFMTTHQSQFLPDTDNSWTSNVSSNSISESSLMVMSMVVFLLLSNMRTWLLLTT